MTSRIEQFLAECSATADPEPRSQGHDLLTEKIAPQIAQLLPPGASILDVGCGQGPALEWFTKHGFKPIGITVGSDDLDVCREAGYSVSLLDQNWLYPMWNGLFDCVWARHVLEHSPIPFFTLKEFYRVLKPGGILYAEMPGPDTDCHHETNGNHYSVFGYRMWINLIQRAGFVFHDGRELHFGTPMGADTYFSFTARKPV